MPELNLGAFSLNVMLLGKVSLLFWEGKKPRRLYVRKMENKSVLMGMMELLFVLIKLMSFVDFKKFVPIFVMEMAIVWKENVLVWVGILELLVIRNDFFFIYLFIYLIIRVGFYLFLAFFFYFSILI